LTRTGESSIVAYHLSDDEADLLFRLSVIIAKQLQELPYEKRDGSSVARAWVNRLVYDIDRSTSEAASLLSLLEFIPATAKALEDDPDSVISALEEVRKYRKCSPIHSQSK
jgi:hypothetical protein